MISKNMFWVFVKVCWETSWSTGLGLHQHPSRQGNKESPFLRNCLGRERYQNKKTNSSGMMDRRVNLISARGAAGAILLGCHAITETRKPWNVARYLRGQVSEVVWRGCDVATWKTGVSCLVFLFRKFPGISVEFATGWGNSTFATNYRRCRGGIAGDFQNFGEFRGTSGNFGESNIWPKFTPKYFGEFRALWLWVTIKLRGTSGSDPNQIHLGGRTSGGPIESAVCLKILVSERSWWGNEDEARKCLMKSSLVNKIAKILAQFLGCPHGEQSLKDISGHSVAKTAPNPSSTLRFSFLVVIEWSAQWKRPPTLCGQRPNRLLNVHSRCSGISLRPTSET